MANVKYQIKTNSKNHFIFVLKALYGLGYKMMDMRNKSAEELIYFPDYPYIVVFDDKKTLSYNDEETANNSFFKNKLVTLDELFDKLSADKVIKIKLNDTHTAEVSKDGIKVGCTIFPLTVIKELQSAIDELGN